VACHELWLAGCFKGCFIGGSIRDVKDILLSKRNNEGNSRASCMKRSKREQRSRNSLKENAAFNKNIIKSGPLIIRNKGLTLVLLVLLIIEDILL
jgi:hypothetical protein